MQGRYRTARSNPNSAVPSDKTARAIKAMGEAAQAEHQAASKVPSATEL